MHEQSRPRPRRAATPTSERAAGARLRQRAVRLRVEADRLDALADQAFRRAARVVAS